MQQYLCAAALKVEALTTKLRGNLQGDMLKSMNGESDVW
jgi:hypothetical protein